MLLEYALKTPLVERIAFVDGLTRTGKGLICRVLSYLKGGDHWRYEVPLEHVCYLHQVGGITTAVAAPFFQFIAEEKTYNRIAGRDLNTRLADESSIYMSPDPDEYIRRSVAEDGIDAVRRFNADGRFPVFDLHNCLASAALVFKALPRARIVHVNRHPVDLVFKWRSRGWGQREISDPFSFVPIVEHADGPVPWFAHDWAEDYHRMNSMERTLESVLRLQEADERSYLALDDERRTYVHRLAFEHLVTDPGSAIDDLCRFFDTEPEGAIEAMLLEERCPRRLDGKERENWLLAIKSDVPTDAIERLQAAAERYEKRWGF